MFDSFNKSALIATLTVCIQFLPTESKATSLITNGNFSVSGSPSLADWNPSGNVEAFSDTGLKNAAPGLSGNSPNGTFADFNPNDASFVASLSQSFSTVAGTSYSLSLLYGAVIDFEGSPTESQSLGVTISDGSTVLLTKTLTAFGDENLSTAFNPYTFSFKGDGGSDTLTFNDESAASFGINGVLTGVGVGVSSVPLPASAPMFGAALLALGAVGYGMKRKAKAAA